MAMTYMTLPEDPAILQAVGAGAIRHGHLDYCLRMCVRSLADVSIEQAIEATERDSSADLRRSITTLAKKRFGEGQTLVLLKALLNRAAEATRKRNDLLHGFWAKELDGPEVMRNRGIEFGPIPTVADLTKVADDLNTIATEIIEARLQGFLCDALLKHPVPK